MELFDIKIRTSGYPLANATQRITKICNPTEVLRLHFKPKIHVGRHILRGFIMFLCSRSVGFFSRAFLVFLMKESKKTKTAGQIDG